MSLAAEKAEKELYDEHQYIDNEWDQPILNADSVEYLEKKIKEEEEKIKE